MTILSFVVPCYNVQDYIQHCLDSIYSCGLPEGQFEVLCINDCSPDGTSAILERNRNNHSNLRIINHETNKGLGGGRNTGIREARGLYLWFVDSDDEVVGGGLSEVVERAIKENLDVLGFNYCRINQKGKKLSSHKVFDETSVDNGYGFVKKTFSESLVNHMGYVWRFLYRTEFLRSNDLIFPEQVRWEDTVFMPKSILLAERIASVPHVFYAYRVNPDSISGVFGKVYPAKSVYEFAFCAGGDLLRFSDEVKDVGLRTSFREAAVNKYINGFAVLLFRTGKEERKKIYDLLMRKKAVVEPLKAHMDVLNRILVSSTIGPVLAELLSFFYKKKHGQKKSVVEFFRFCIVGGIATALHYGIYYVIIHCCGVEGEFGTNVAYTIGYVLSWFVNLYLTAHFTFREVVTLKRGTGFAASHCINYLMHIVFLNTFLAIGVSDEIAPLCVFAFVIPINFLLVRFVFKSKTFQKRE